MTDLLDHQWELGGVVFGLDCRVQSDPGVTPPSSDSRNQDTVNPVGDNMRMGRDRKTPGTWALKLFVDEDSEETALDALDELGSVWDADEVRDSPGEVMVMRYRLAGRIRRVYGRPNRWTPTLDNALLNGYIAITADFRLTSPYFYDDVEESQEITALPATTESGFTVPFTAPIQTSEVPEPEIQEIVISGRKATPVVLEFAGPSINPVLEIGGWRAALIGTIPDGRSIILDARPWVMALYYDDGQPADPSMISRSTLMQDMKLSPGSHEASYTNEDTSGRSTVTVRWRGAHTSL